MQLISDTHSTPLEEALDIVDTTLILAGDIGTGLKSLLSDLEWAAANYEHVVYVPGNHDLYLLGGLGRAKQELQLFLASQLPNNVILAIEPIIVKIDNTVIAACTLWSNVSDAAVAPYISDYIFHSFEELNNEHLEHVQFLTNVEADIIVTHHMPSFLSVSEKYKGHFLNECFATPLDDLITSLEPDVWVHGHSHETTDYAHPSGTRVLSNPFGYIGENNLTRDNCESFTFN